MIDVELLPCPFCGHEGVYFTHGYSDESCQVGCGNENCFVRPRASAFPQSKPWDETKTTFYKLWDEAELEAANNWNKRTNFGG
jgi:hypothetical protein